MSRSWFADLLDSTRFLQRYPAFAGLTASLEPMATDAVPSMAIGRHLASNGREVLRLYVNADYFAEHPEHFAGILQHELHHVLCGHLHDVRFHRVASPQWMEIAMETCANENITEATPPGYDWQSFRKFGLRAGQSTMERSELLVRAVDEGRLRMMTEEQLDKLCPGWRDRLGEDGERGKPGGARIVVMPKRPMGLPGLRGPRVIGGRSLDEHRPSSTLKGGARGIGDALDRGSDGAQTRTWDQSSWLLGMPTDQDELREMELRIRAFLRGERGGAGDHLREGPRTVKELSRQVSHQPLIDGLAWPAILRHLLPQFRNVWPTYMRPNRRFPDRLGELPGRQRRVRRPRLLVGLDTSASMATHDLGNVGNELRRLRRYADCTIAECDAAVHRVHRDREIDLVTGGGDTDFGALFELVGDGSSFDGVVYFTDGVGKWPDLPPSRPVLWVITGERAFDCPWGVTVALGR